MQFVLWALAKLAQQYFAACAETQAAKKAQKDAMNVLLHVVGKQVCSGEWSCAHLSLGSAVWAQFEGKLLRAPNFAAVVHDWGDECSKKV